MNAGHRFNNSLRYRDPRDPAQTALTPAYILEPIREVLGGCIDLDPCTLPDNPCGARVFYAPPQDGLSLPWFGRIFVNPPYGKAREPWVRRCVSASQDGANVILLIPAHPDTRIFAAAARASTSMLFLRGRLKFEVLRPNRRRAAASHPSVLIGFGVDLRPIERLGIVVKYVGAAA